MGKRTVEYEKRFAASLAKRVREKNRGKPSPLLNKSSVRRLDHYGIATTMASWQFFNQRIAPPIIAQRTAGRAAIAIVLAAGIGTLIVRNSPSFSASPSAGEDSTARNRVFSKQGDPQKRENICEPIIFLDTRSAVKTIMTERADETVTPAVCMTGIDEKLPETPIDEELQSLIENLRHFSINEKLDGIAITRGQKSNSWFIHTMATPIDAFPWAQLSLTQNKQGSFFVDGMRVPRPDVLHVAYEGIHSVVQEAVRRRALRHLALLLARVNDKKNRLVAKGYRITDERIELLPEDRPKIRYIITGFNTNEESRAYGYTTAKIIFIGDESTITEDRSDHFE